MRLSPKLIAAALCTPLLSSCGTFPLASSIQAPVGTSGLQKQTDTLACTHQAELAQNSAGQQAKDFLLGATIIGAPFAYQMDKATARNAFANCMTARGYNLRMPDGSSRQSTVSPAAESHARMEPSRISDKTGPIEEAIWSSVGMSLPKGWSKSPLPKGIINPNILFYASNITSDSALFLQSFPIESISNVEEFANSQTAALASRLADAKRSDVRKLYVNGRESFQFVVSGVTSNTNISYIFTVIEGKTDVAVLNAWTTFANFPSQRSALEQLAYTVNFSERHARKDEKKSEASPAISSSTGLKDRAVSYKSGFEPAYPQLAVDNRHEGTTTVLALVGANGDVISAEVEVSSGYPELDQAAIETVYTWKFNPEIKDGRYVRSVARLPVNFNLSQVHQ